MYLSFYTIDREHTEASIDRANLYSIAKLELVILFVELSDALRVEIRLSEACSRVILVRGVLEYRCLVVTNAYIGIPLHWVAVLVCVCFSEWVSSCCTPCEGSYLVDPASSHMLVSKIKPCMSKYKHLYCETANGSLNQLSFI